MDAASLFATVQRQTINLGTVGEILVGDIMTSHPCILFQMIFIMESTALIEDDSVAIWKWPQLL